MLADKGARIGAARRRLGQCRKRVIDPIVLGRGDNRRAGQGNDAQIVNLQRAAPAVAIARDDELDPIGMAQRLVVRRAPGKADLACGDHHVAPLGRGAVIAPHPPPDIVAVGQLDLQIVAPAGPAHPKAKLKIARQIEIDLAAQEGVARDATVIIGETDRAAAGDARCGDTVRCICGPVGGTLHWVGERQIGERLASAEQGERQEELERLHPLTLPASSPSR